MIKKQTEEGKKRGVSMERSKAACCANVVGHFGLIGSEFQKKKKKLAYEFIGKTQTQLLLFFRVGAGFLLVWCSISHCVPCYG